MADVFDKEWKEGGKKFQAASKDLVTEYKKYQKAMLDNVPFDNKTKELMFLGISAAIQCMYCIKTHSQRAKVAGATDQELAAVIHMAASIKHGATVSYGVNALS